MSGKRPVRVIFQDQAKEEIIMLNKVAGDQEAKGVKNSEELRLIKSIRQKADLIKRDPFFGDNMPKGLIPKTLGVTNLFRVELTGYWRMLYTLKGDEIEIVAIVLLLVDHERYNKIFGYKGR